MTIYVHGRVLYSVKKVTSNQSYHKLCRLVCCLWPHWSISKENYAVHYRQSTHDSNLFLVIGSFVSRRVYKYMYHRVRWQISFTTYTASSSRAHVPETDTPSKPRERQREGKKKKKRARGFRKWSLSDCILWPLLNHSGLQQVHKCPLSSTNVLLARPHR